MIRPIDIKLNAAHPELPLVEATTFTGAPSSVFIRGVPKAVGNWSITAVNVAVTYPDNSTTTRAAVESAEGVWVATIPGTATSGRTAAGFKIMADGIDENGAAVTGYVLGFADFSVLSFTPVPAPGGTFYLLRYFDQAPATPKEGDVAKIDGVLKFYNGSAWEPFAAEPTIDDAVTKDSANAVKSSGIWSAIWGALIALPTGFTSLYDWVVDQLSGYKQKQSPVSDPTVEGTAVEAYAITGITQDENGVIVPAKNYLPTAAPTEYMGGQNGLMSASDKSKLDAVTVLTSAQLANIAAVSDAPAFDATHSYAAGDPVVYNGTLYTFTATHTGAWTGSDVSEVDVTARLNGKLDKSGDTMTGTLQIGDNAAENIILNPSNATITAEFIKNNYSSDRCLVPNGPGTLALTAGPNHTGNLAALDASGNLTDAGWTAGELARYSLVTKTIDNGAVTLDDRAINAVAVSSSLASLTVNFPTATSGKVRDFAMRLNIAAGVTAPEIAWPQGVTLENDGGEVPEIADGGTGGSSTILYFSETENDGTTAKFLVKGETLTAITQA